MTTLKCPSMHNRSHEEVYYHCEWLSRLGMLSMDRLVNAMNEGDQRGLMDACFVGLPGVPDHGSENDHGYYHDESRLDGDVAKTKRMLSDPNLLVCRVRIAAPPMGMEDPRLVVVHVEKTSNAVNAMCQSFSKHVTDVSIRWRLLHAQKKDTEIDNVAHKFFMWVDSEYKQQFETLSVEFGITTAPKLLRIHGVRSRVANGSVSRILKRLMGAPYNVKNLQTFMCGWHFCGHKKRPRKQNLNPSESDSVQ